MAKITIKLATLLCAFVFFNQVEAQVLEGTLRKALVCDQSVGPYSRNLYVLEQPTGGTRSLDLSYISTTTVTSLIGQKVSIQYTAPALAPSQSPSSGATPVPTVKATGTPSPFTLSQPLLVTSIQPTASKTPTSFKSSANYQPDYFQYSPGSLLINSLIGSSYTLLSAFDGSRLVSHLPNQEASTLYPNEFPTPLVGPRTVAAILINLTDQAVIEDRNLVTLRLFTSDTGRTVKNQWNTTSFGLMSANQDADGNGSPDVFGPFTVNYRKSQGCLYEQWTAAALGMAQAQGFVASRYDHLVFVLPSNAGNPTLNLCGFGGLATVGGRDSYIALPATDAYGHEMGHNLGFNHSARQTATGVEEYGDISCPMGLSGGPMRLLYNAVHNAEASWAKLSNVQSEVTSEGVFNFEVAPLEKPIAESSLPRIVRIDVPGLYDANSQRYYLSYRRNIGTFAFVPDGWVDRLNIHKYTGTQGVQGRTGAFTYFLRALLDNEEFTDPKGLKIKQLSHSLNSVSFEVRVNTADSDGDGVKDLFDNCPNVANANQADWNTNGIGDFCDIPRPYSNLVVQDNQIVHMMPDLYQAYFTWQDNTQGESGSYLQRATSPTGPFTNVYRQTPDSNQTEGMTGLRTDTTYYFRLEIFNSVGSSYSNVVSFRPSQYRNE